MGPHDELIAKWSAQLGSGLAMFDAVIDPADLRSDSFCASNIVVITDSPAGSGDLLVATDSAADFVAFARWAVLPHALGQGTQKELLEGEAENWGSSAEGASDSPAPADVDASIEVLLVTLQTDAAAEVRECLEIMDAILRQDLIGLEDARRAATAYNCIWQFEEYGGYESRFVVLGSIAAALSAYREWLESFAEEASRESDEVDPHQVAARELVALLDSDAFDACVPEHLDLVRSVWDVIEESIM